jgi:hypothetical protein
MNISLDQYWERLSDHYYDNVHWDHAYRTHLIKWVETEYRCTVDTSERVLRFQDPKDLTRFMFKWL